MKIKFIMPKWPMESMWGKMGSGIPSLSLATIAALTPPDIDISIKYDERSPINYDEPLDIVAMTGMTPVAKRAYEIAAEFKKRGVYVVMGGIHATLMPDEVSQHVDTVFVGEGEGIWEEFLEDFKNKRQKKLYKNTNLIDLTKSPVPRLDFYKGLDPLGIFFPNRISVTKEMGFFLPNIIQTTRGCPFDCDFCTVTKFFGPSYRYKSYEQIRREIESMDRTRFRGNEVFFADDNICCNRQYLKGMCEAITEYKLDWYCQATASVAEDDEALKYLEKAGCKVFFIGFDSLNQESLNDIHKKHNTVKKYIDTINKIHDHGISLHGSFMFGFDHDDISVFENFLEFAHKTQLDAAFLTIVTPFPNTTLFHRLNKENRIISYDWNKYDISTVVYKPKKMTVEQLQEGYYWMFREFHSTKNIFQRLYGHTPSYRINIGSNLAFKIFGGKAFPKQKNIERFKKREKGNKLEAGSAS